MRIRTRHRRLHGRTRAPSTRLVTETLERRSLLAANPIAIGSLATTWDPAPPAAIATVTPPVMQDRPDTITATPVTSIGFGSSYALGFAGDGAWGSRDVDFYGISVPESGKLVIQAFAFTMSPRSPLDTYLRLFDQAGRQIGVNDDWNGTTDSRLETGALPGGLYYVGVSGYGNGNYDPLTAGSGTFGSTGTYAIALNVMPGGVTIPPVPPVPQPPVPIPTPTPVPIPTPQPPTNGLDVGDTLAAAVPVFLPPVGIAARFPSFLGDGMQQARDVDMYRVDVPAGSGFTVEVFARRLPVRSDLDSYLRVFDSNGAQIAWHDDLVGSNDSLITLSRLAGGTYFVGVSAFPNGTYDPRVAGSGASGSTGTYEISFTALNSTPTPIPPTPIPPTPIPPTPTPIPGPAFPTPTFNSTFGWGLADASAAVARLLGRDTAFPTVTDLGGRDWANDMVNAPEVWAQGYTGRGVVVAVVDSGVDYSHPDLYANIWINQREIPATLRSSVTDVDRDGMITFRDLNTTVNTSFVIDVDRNGRIDAADLRADRRWMNGRDDSGDGSVDDLFGRDFVGNDADPTDEIDLRMLPDGPNGQLRRGNPGHGTHVSGTIAAMNNGVGVTGVAYDALVMPVRVMNARGFGNENVIANGIRYAVDQGANVINLSLGGAVSSAISSAVLYASSRGVAVVVAAGNSGGSSPSAPADLASTRGANIISVGAVDSSGALASFSNRAGSSSAMRHIVAPGVSIFSTLPRSGIGQDSGNQNGFGSMSGTSMAAPHVAGVVALCRSAIANPPTNLQRLSWPTIAVGTARQPAASRSMTSVVSSVAQLGIVSVGGAGIRTASSIAPAPRAPQRAEALRAFAATVERRDEPPAAARHGLQGTAARGTVVAPRVAPSGALPRLTVCIGS